MQVANALQSLKEQCKSGTKKLILGCRVSVSRSKVTWKITDSLPNVQKLLVRFFHQTIPKIKPGPRQPTLFSISSQRGVNLSDHIAQGPLDNFHSVHQPNRR